MTPDSLADMRKRAAAWLYDAGTGELTTRDTAIGEDHMALDVIELLGEVERLEALAESAVVEHGQLERALDDALLNLEQVLRQRDELKARLNHAIEENMAFNFKVAKEINELRAALSKALS